MQRRDRPNVWLSIMLSLILVGFLAACGGQSQGTQAETPETVEPFANEVPLSNSYARIVVTAYTAGEEVTRDYGYALEESHAALMAALIKQGQFHQVNQTLKSAPDGCLLLETHVPEMRIVSGAARFWGGAFAGNSNMVLDVKLVDAKTQTVVREKRFESSNNAFAAAWTYGSSDRSLPTDMGNIVADYIAKVVPTH